MNASQVLPARRRLTVDDYHRMGDVGILGKDDRIELIDGELIDMAPIGQCHAAIVSCLVETLVVACSSRAIVWPQNPVRLDQWNEPQPDLAVLRRRADFYATGERPRAADVLLLVEVADSSLRYDRSVKLPLYARAGVAEYWIVDLVRRDVDVHRTQTEDTYRETTKFRSGDQVRVALAPDIVVNLALKFE